MKKATCVLVFGFFIGGSSPLHAYDPDTHGEIAQRAAQPSISTLEQVLKGELGLPNGIGERFPGQSRPGLRTVEQIIGDGAFFEDVPAQRSLNHFHNPLQPWDQAGLRALSVPLFGFSLIRGQSSVLWQQNTNQNFTFVSTPVPIPSLGGNWSWQDARRHYLNALTRPRNEDRENEPGRDTAFAETFEALGRLTHLVQDASVPAHVRNDPHPRPLRNPDWYEDWVEETRVNNSTLFQSLLNSYNKDLHRPPFSIFTPTGDIQAPVPIARLMDADKFLGLNFSVLTDLDLGITEYTNGNFVSRDTIFTDFDLPRQSSLDPNFRVELFGSKFRRYLRKVSEGESPIDHFVTESLLHESIKEALGAGPLPAAAWYLDDRVHEDYAKLLLPRAVGYSAGLLDYFFRGTLDVDLLPDPESTDPTVVKLSGTYETTNGSIDTLVDGTLALYADGPDGTRSPVPSLEPLNVSNIAPGQEISRRFQLPQDSERFMAVYQGTLGSEIRDEANGFPGGVIGKVLGGVRAEVIFPDGDKRKLRAVDGIFELPPEADDLRAIQWGDRDNTFVGNLSSATGGSDEFMNFPDQGIRVFKIDRSEGSPEAPLVDGTNIVRAEVLKTVNLPADLPMDVNVNYSQTVRFQQFLVTYTLIDTWVWNGSFYELSREVIDPSEAELVVNETFQFAQSFPLILDQAHRIGGSFTPYTWSVQEVGFDQQGRVLAVVKVSLTRPDDNRRRLHLKRRNPQCQLVEDPFLPQDIFANFPVSDPILAVVDVEGQRVIGGGEQKGATTSSTFSPSSNNTISRLLLQQRVIQSFIGGGPSDGLTQEFCLNASFGGSGNPSVTTVETLTISAPPTGLLSLELPGRFRADLEPLAIEPFGVSAVRRDSLLVYFVDSDARTNRAIRLINSFSGITGTFTFSPRAKLMRPTPGDSPELLLLFPQRECHSEGCFVAKESPLVRWSPQFPANSALALPEKLPASHFYNLAYATSGAALIEFEDLDIFWLSTWIADFASKKLKTIQGTPPIILSREYVLLDAKFLYNINDTRFHTLDDSLRPTVLPRPLAEAPSAAAPSSAPYHLIRLR